MGFGGDLGKVPGGLSSDTGLSLEDVFHPGEAWAKIVNAVSPPTPAPVDPFSVGPGTGSPMPGIPVEIPPDQQPAPSLGFSPEDLLHPGDAWNKLVNRILPDPTTDPTQMCHPPGGEAPSTAPPGPGIPVDLSHLPDDSDAHIGLEPQDLTTLNLLTHPFDVANRVEGAIGHALAPAPDPVTPFTGMFD